MDQEINIKFLLKLFLIPSIAGIIFGIISIGISNITSNIISASLIIGVEFLFTASVFILFMKLTEKINIIILYTAIGSGSGLTWRSIVGSHYSFFIPTVVGGILAGIWAYTKEEYNK